MAALPFGPACRVKAHMYECDSPYHRVRVADDDGIRRLTFERNRQSSMWLDDPFETDIEYVAYLHLTMAITPTATRTLLLGLGGGSVVKRMWRDYPDMRVDAVEIDPAVAEVAQTYFALPEDERIRVFIEDGREYMDRCAETYDIIIVDAFDDDRVPRPLLTEEFMRECRECLAPAGVIAYNFIGAVYGPRSKPFRSLYRTAANVWRQVWVFPIGSGKDPRDNTRNIIMLGTDAEITQTELLERIAGRAGGRVTVPRFECLGEDLHTGAIRSGDVPLIVDTARRKLRRRR